MGSRCIDIIIDTREGRSAWSFAAQKQARECTVEVQHQKTGDLTTKHLLNIATIESKSISDIVGCISGWRRWEGELRRGEIPPDTAYYFHQQCCRLSHLRAGQIWIMGDPADIYERRYLKYMSIEDQRALQKYRMDPNSIMGKLASIEAEFHIPVHFRGPRPYFEDFAVRQLRQWEDKLLTLPGEEPF